MKLFILPRIHQNIVRELESDLEDKKIIKVICLKHSKYDERFSSFILERSNFFSTLSKLILGDLPNNGFIVPSYLSLKYLFNNILKSEFTIIRELRFPTTLFSILIAFFWNKKIILKIQHNNSSVPLSYLLIFKIFKTFGRSIRIDNALPFNSSYFSFVPFIRPKFSYSIRNLPNDFSEITITSIGKLESRKKLKFSLMVAEELALKDNFNKIRLNIFMTFKDIFSKKIYKDLVEYRENITSTYPKIDIFFFKESSNSDVLKALANSHIYLHPADNESASYSVIEAYSAGAYVISKSDCFTTDYLPFKKCGIKINNFSCKKVADYILENFNMISDFENRKFRSNMKF